MPGDNLWVGELPAGISQDEVTACFMAYGQVTHCRVMPSKQGAASSALVRFSTVEEAEDAAAAIAEMDNLVAGLEEPVIVKYASTPRPVGASLKPGGVPPWQAAARPPAMLAASKAPGVSPGSITALAVRPAASAALTPTLVPSRKGKLLPEASNGGAFPPPCPAAGASGGQWENRWQQKWEAPPSKPNDNVYISDLPADLGQEQIESVFASYGTIVRCRSLPPKIPGGPGAALVQYSSIDEATWVVENLDGTTSLANMPDGLEQPLIVKYANSRPWTGGGGGSWVGAAATGSAAGAGFRAPAAGSVRQLVGAIKASGALGIHASGVSPDCQLYVSQLPQDCSDVDLYKLFASFGPIANGGVKAMCYPDGTCKGFGFVDFLSAEAAAEAVSALHGFSVDGAATLYVSLKQAPRDGSKGERPVHASQQY